jgi:hypothetical protein
VPDTPTSAPPNPTPLANSALLEAEVEKFVQMGMVEAAVAVWAGSRSRGGAPLGECGTSTSNGRGVGIDCRSGCGHRGPGGSEGGHAQGPLGLDGDRC